MARARPRSFASHHQKSLTLTTCDVDPHLVHDRDAVVESRRPSTRSSNGVPLTMLAGSGMSQWLCTSIDAHAAAADRDLTARRVPERAAAVKPRPAMYAPAVACATVLKNCLRLGMSPPVRLKADTDVYGPTRSGFSRTYDVIRNSFVRLPLRICFLLRVVEKRRVEHEIDGDRPVERVVRAVDDLADAHLGHEVPQSFVRKDHRVDRGSAIAGIPSAVSCWRSWRCCARRTPLRCA